MRLLKIFLFIQIVMIAPLMLTSAMANKVEECRILFHPIENTANSIKSRGGVWALIEKRAIYRKHATIGLHVDSKIASLIYTINYVCDSQEGMPINSVANQVVPMMKERGLEAFIEYYLNLSHPLAEVKVWAKYADYFEANRHRKLDFNQTKNTIEIARTFFERYTALNHKIKSTNDVEGVGKEGQAIIDEILQFHATDPILKQVNAENLEIPHASTLTQVADEM
ncbi:MAG: hypothetical protein HN472_14410 [Nitrospina sp.]|jgi:hypothetical protein|nr:hypothetical protein [Nitrospina sp.]MBT3510727.1 hypothetical protein [Nitrospina sp.]MBT3875996.1 hypothetical protein [Nitrospina sp.]MBT4048961.1 hypothetical protein [Nitrospina sp.]MBT4557639.1 hypothetical protein [Nitrospina sp.]